MQLLTTWENFYVIVGSSAGALIGLQFVVMSLIANLPVSQVDAAAGEAFATPTIIHFGTVLFLAGVLSAPWESPVVISIIWGLAGLAGMIYVVIVVRRMHRQNAYKPVFEDWLFHVLLPIVAYLILAVSACTSRTHLRESLFGVAAAVLLLLFIGIHNSWDAVTYNLFVRRPAMQRAKESEQK